MGLSISVGQHQNETATSDFGRSCARAPEWLHLNRIKSLIWVEAICLQ
jgi:hypothetical protein